MMWHDGLLFSLTLTLPTHFQVPDARAAVISNSSTDVRLAWRDVKPQFWGTTGFTQLIYSELTGRLHQT